MELFVLIIISIILIYEHFTYLMVYTLKYNLFIIVVLMYYYY